MCRQYEMPTTNLEEKPCSYIYAYVYQKVPNFDMYDEKFVREVVIFDLGSTYFEILQVCRIVQSQKTDTSVHEGAS